MKKKPEKDTKKEKEKEKEREKEKEKTKGDSSKEEERKGKKEKEKKKESEAVETKKEKNVRDLTLLTSIWTKPLRLYLSSQDVTVTVAAFMFGLSYKNINDRASH